MFEECVMYVAVASVRSYIIKARARPLCYGKG